MALKNAAGKERRELDRTTVEVTLPVQVLLAGSDDAYPCRIFDVSSGGLAVVGETELAEGTELTFVTLKARVSLIVAWCRPEAAHTFRCGLRLASGSGDLSAVFPGYLAAASRR